MRRLRPREHNLHFIPMRHERAEQGMGAEQGVGAEQGMGAEQRMYLLCSLPYPKQQTA